MNAFLVFGLFCILYGALVGCVAAVIQIVFGDGPSFVFTFIAGVAYGWFVFGGS